MIKDFIENQKIKVPFLVAGINKGINTNTGKQYYSISLQDASGTIEGKKWEITDEDTQIIAVGKVIEVVGPTLGEEAWNEIEVLVNRVKTEKYLF